MVSGTSAPCRMWFSALDKANVCSREFCVLASRNRSPVERWQAPYLRDNKAACVPLPTPGAPSNTTRSGRFNLPGRWEHFPMRPRNQAARSFCDCASMGVPITLACQARRELTLDGVEEDDCDGDHRSVCVGQASGVSKAFNRKVR